MQAVLNSQVESGAARSDRAGYAQPSSFVNRQARIRWLEEASERIACEIVGATRQGLTIELMQPFSPGSMVRLAAAEVLIMGEISCCKPDRGTYVAELVIDDSMEIGSLSLSA